jgi:hypothetical protein
MMTSASCSPTVVRTPDGVIAVIRSVTRSTAVLLSEAGLAVGREYHATTFGLLGLAFISSPTVRDAVNLALRYLDLSFTFSIPRATLIHDQVRLEPDDRMLLADLTRFLIDRDLAAVHTIISELLPGGVPVAKIDFRSPNHPLWTNTGRRSGCGRASAARRTWRRSMLPISTALCHRRTRRPWPCARRNAGNWCPGGEAGPVSRTRCGSGWLVSARSPRACPESPENMSTRTLRRKLG